jgi:hypothetical protein
MSKKTGVPASCNPTEVEPFVEKWLGVEKFPKEIAAIREKLLKALESAMKMPTNESRFSSHRINRSSNYLEAYLENIAGEHKIRGNNCIIRWWRKRQKEKAPHKIDHMRDTLSQEIKELIERQRKQQPEGATLEANLDYLADKILSSLIGTSYRKKV